MRIYFRMTNTKTTTDKICNTHLSHLIKKIEQKKTKAQSIQKLPEIYYLPKTDNVV